MIAVIYNLIKLKILKIYLFNNLNCQLINKMKLIIKIYFC